MMILGFDLSLNHAAMVGLDPETADMVWYEYVIDTATGAKAGKKRGVHLKYPKSKDRTQHQMNRLLWWRLYLIEMYEKAKPSHVVIEDYALMAKSNSAYQIGELGCLARIGAIEVGAALRLHDPMSVKMFLAHSGNATPEEVRDAVFERWPITRGFAALPDLATLDLVVAFGLARMGWTELELRAGRLRLEDLHPKEVQVFNRTTKAYTVSLLGREWLQRSYVSP